ncbi:MAG: pyridoxamine 5'-phosphate oxidase family protein [Alistipes sp.]|nr:pyridoxamine 5'-phosphate oxidase family protein [Alistipes sp.]
MFREMRRKRQQLTRLECETILHDATSGVLALAGDDGYPYAVPVSFVYGEGRLYFHSALKGHKIDAIRQSDKASFCVIDRDDIVAEEYTTYFRSVIAFGRIRIIESRAAKRAAIELLAAKYSPEHPKGREREINSGFDGLCMIEFEIEHLTGKQAIELVHDRE